MKIKQTHAKSCKTSNLSWKEDKVPSLHSPDVEAASSNDANVSVFTKNRNPKVIVRSENLEGSCDTISHQKLCKHKILKFLCLIVMCIIVLMTFFLSLSTYNTVSKLSHLLWL